jgi:hypothetical protein
MFTSQCKRSFDLLLLHAVLDGWIFHWSSRTWNNGGTYLTVQDDGIAVVYRPSDGKAVWNTPNPRDSGVDLCRVVAVALADTDWAAPCDSCVVQQKHICANRRQATYIPYMSPTFHATYGPQNVVRTDVHAFLCRHVLP